MEVRKAVLRSLKEMVASFVTSDLAFSGVSNSSGECFR